MNKKNVVVLDYGMGNLHSVAKALEHVAADFAVDITNDPARMQHADKIVFPGVGAIGHCMAAIHAMQLDAGLAAVYQKIPILAICVGMQALFDWNEESAGVAGFGWLEGCVCALQPQTDMPVPHMGWNTVAIVQQHPLFHNIADNEHFYFVHSYAAVGMKDCIGTTQYTELFGCAYAQPNLCAVQFHPEKSGAAGLQLLRNFMRSDDD